MQEYRLINSWPSVIKYGELTYTTSDIKKVEVTLTYDWAEEITQNSPDETSNSFGQTGGNIDRSLPVRPRPGKSGGE